MLTCYDLQETTSTFFTAALASKRQPASQTSDNSVTDEGSSSRTNILLSQTGTGNNSADGRPSTNHEIVQENSCSESAVKVNSAPLFGTFGKVLIILLALH